VTDARDTQPPRTRPTPGARRAEIARWERERARGRMPFIIRRGVVGWGVPAALLTIAYKLLQAHAFTWALVRSHQIRVAIGVATAVFLTCGYLFGHWLWRAGEANYGRLKREEEAGR
jgi:hypothetical protein